MASLNFNAANVKPLNAQEAAPDVARTWSLYQNNIFSWVETGTGSAIVIAVAGSGKTTTGVEAVRRVQRMGQSHIFLAFNKSIATELQARDVNGATFHSACMRVVKSAFRGAVVEGRKLWQLCHEYLSEEDHYLYASFIVDLVSKGKQAGIGVPGMVEDTDAAWYDLVEHYNLELEAEKAEMHRAVFLASRLLEASVQDKTRIDFDDMLYWVVRLGLRMPQYDWVFVDELQDTNDLQLAIIQKMMKPTSRFMGVGDPAQAIYGFRGANADAVERIKARLGCKELPLTVSYRCPQEVVKYAQTWVTHIEAAPNAPEGKVTELGRKWDPKAFGPTDLVGCRTTAPLIGLAYRMLKDHLPVQVMGREIGAGLKALVRKLMPKPDLWPDAIAELLKRLDNWEAREVADAMAKDKEAKAKGIEDKAACIRCLAESLPEDQRTIDSLMDVINRLFADRTNCVRLGTIHKLKGLEGKRVYWLNYRWVSKWALMPWMQQQERHLCYVMATRAQEELVLIEEK